MTEPTSTNSGLIPFTTINNDSDNDNNDEKGASLNNNKNKPNVTLLKWVNQRIQKQNDHLYKRSNQIFRFAMGI